MQNPSIENLQEGPFVCKDVLDIYNPVPFFQKENKGTILFTVTLLTFAGTGFFFGAELSKVVRDSSLLEQRGIQYLLGLSAVFLILLPIHELIHALVFYLQGARDIRFSFSKKGFAVFTVANQFVLNMQQLIVVAIAPFVSITVALAVLAWQLPNWAPFFITALCFHALCCFGDFILINYAVKYKQRFNFDDFEKGESYFFEKAQAS